MQCLGKHSSMWHTRTWLLRIPIFCCYRNNLFVTQRWGMYVICPLLSFSDQYHIAQTLIKPTQGQKPSHLQPELEGMGVSHTGLVTPPISGTRFSASWVWLRCLMAPLLPCLCHWAGNLSQMPARVNSSFLWSSSQDVTVCHHDEKDNMDPLLSSESAIAGQEYLTTVFWTFSSTLRIWWGLGHTQIT